MGTLEVVRLRAASSVLRSFRILIDGEMVGKVRHGDRLSVPALAGTRRVEARIDWTGSPVLLMDVAKGGVTTLTCEPAPFLESVRLIFARPQEYLRLKLSQVEGWN